MEGKKDELKGRAKQAAGDLTGDRDLKREGKVDETGAKFKQKAEDAKDWIGDKVDDLKK